MSSNLHGSYISRLICRCARSVQCTLLFSVTHSFPSTMEIFHFNVILGATYIKKALLLLEVHVITSQCHVIDSEILFKRLFTLRFVFVLGIFSIGILTIICPTAIQHFSFPRGFESFQLYPEIFVPVKDYFLEINMNGG